MAELSAWPHPWMCEATAVTATLAFHVIATRHSQPPCHTPGAAPSAQPHAPRVTKLPLLFSSPDPHIRWPHDTAVTRHTPRRLMSYVIQYHIIHNGHTYADMLDRHKSATQQDHAAVSRLAAQALPQARLQPPPHAWLLLHFLSEQ